MEPHFDYKEILSTIKTDDEVLAERAKKILYIDDDDIDDKIEFPGSALLHFYGNTYFDGIIDAEILKLDHIGTKNFKRYKKEAVRQLHEVLEKKYKILKHYSFDVFFCHNLLTSDTKVLNSYKWLREIKTSFGKAYYQISVHSTKPIITVFTSHFFDRYAVRIGIADNILEAQKKRKEAIYSYLGSNLSNKKTRNEFLEDENHDIAIGTDNGLCLGVKYENVILVKTFVSNDMLRGNQQFVAEETTISLAEKFQQAVEKEQKRFEENGYSVDKEGTIRKINDIGRNDQCPCGSGKKYKKCCLIIK